MTKHRYHIEAFQESKVIRIPAVLTIAGINLDLPKMLIAREVSEVRGDCYLTLSSCNGNPDEYELFCYLKDQRWQAYVALERQLRTDSENVALLRRCREAFHEHGIDYRYKSLESATFSDLRDLDGIVEHHVSNHGAVRLPNSRVGAILHYPSLKYNPDYLIGVLQGYKQKEQRYREQQKIREAVIDDEDFLGELATILAKVKVEV